jgi:hypothetical protein
MDETGHTSGHVNYGENIETIGWIGRGKKNNTNA